MNDGLCQCGCGARTPLARQTDKRRGVIKGQPVKFVLQHAQRGVRSVHWKGGVNARKDGYVTRVAHGHPRADADGRVLEHILIAEGALGKPLPAGAVVHHTDEQQGRVDPRGLVICPDNNYHRLIHQRSRALAACGHADWRKCNICKRYDAPENLVIWGGHGIHQSCRRRRSLLRRGDGMLRDIRARFGHIPELADVTAEIDRLIPTSP